MRTLRYPTNHQVARSGIPRLHHAALSRLNSEKSTDLYLVSVESLKGIGRGVCKGGNVVDLRDGVLILNFLLLTCCFFPSSLTLALSNFEKVLLYSLKRF